MFVLALRHRVSDFDSWKSVFDQRLDARLKGAVVGHRLTRSVVDPNEVKPFDGATIPQPRLLPARGL